MEFKDDGIANTLTQEQLGQMTDEPIEEMAALTARGYGGRQCLCRNKCRAALLRFGRTHGAGTLRVPASLGSGFASGVPTLGEPSACASRSAPGIACS